MSLLEVTGLTQEYGDKLLYKNAAFSLLKGEHLGVVGPNGVGKSTLLRILTGETVPDAGRVFWQPGITAGYLDQYARVDERQTVEQYLHTAFSPLYETEAKMLDLYGQGALPGRETLLEQAAQLQEALLQQEFYQTGAKVARVAAGLGLDALGLDRPLGRLSGGQRAKVILAKLLLQRADVLLLDEPTNYLDTVHIDWLAGYLSCLEGAYIVVSHDYDFLERISTGILDIEFGSIAKYNGSYRHFLAQKAFRREDYLRRYHAQKREIERTEAYIRKNIAGVNTRIAKGRRKQLARVERLAPPGSVTPPALSFDCRNPPSGKVLEVEALEVGYTSPLLPPVSFSLSAGQVLAVTGFNGIGKSTLLKTLVGSLPPLGGSFRYGLKVELGYYEQELRWPQPEQTPLAVVQAAFPALESKGARRELALCGMKAEHMGQPVATLSGGEQAKVKLCLLIQQKAGLLVLDEPTNHLDALAKEALQKALERFCGSVILVSHEERFYLPLAAQVLHLGQSARTTG